MAGRNNTPLVGIGVVLFLLASCSVSEACWWKCRGAGPTYAYPLPAYPSAYPYPPAAGGLAGPAPMSATGDPLSRQRGDFSAAVRQCPPGMVPVRCDTDSGLWQKTSLEDADGCADPSLVGTSCAGAKKGPKDGKEERMKDGQRPPLQPMVCDAETHRFRRANPGERPHAYLPQWYLGKPCQLPKS